MSCCSRRGFLTRIVGVGAAAAVSAELAACAATGIYRTTIDSGSVSIELTELATLMGEGNAAIISAPGLAEPILILRHAAGDLAPVDDAPFTAIGSRCTHLGCRVRPTGQVLTCPCHGSAFGLDGHLLRGPAQKPLTRYELEIHEGRLTVSGV